MPASPDTPVRFRIGSLDLIVVSDGTIRFDGGATFGLVPRTMWEPLVADEIDEQHTIPAALNCLLIRSRGTTILVETGVGEKQPSAGGGLLLANLAKLGVRPDDVDVVVNTHLHFDHCGGNTVRDGDTIVPAFPRARYVIRRGEYEAATNPNDRTRGTYFAENFAPLVDAGRIELIDGEHSITDEVRVIDTPGHTADHAAVAVVSGGESAVYIGDMAQHPAHLERYAWISAFDVLPLVSLETKKRLVEDAIEHGRLIVSTHVAYPGAGYIELDGRRRRWREAVPDTIPAPGG